MFLLLFLSVRVVLQLWKDLVLCEPIANTDHVWLDNQCWGFWGQGALLRGHVAAATMTTHPPRQWDQPQSWKQCSDGKESHKNQTKSTNCAQRQFFLQWQLEENRGHFGSLEAHHGAARGDETPRRTSFYYICPKPLAFEDPGLLRTFSPLYFH